MTTLSMPAPHPAPPPAGGRTIHPLWLRCVHWVNAVAVVLLVASGWRIFNASPLFDFRFPAPLTLGGWLGGALQWHFAANGLLYLALNLLSGRGSRRLLPVSLRGVVADALSALKGNLSHADPAQCNQVQKLVDLAVVLNAVQLVPRTLLAMLRGR